MTHTIYLIGTDQKFLFQTIFIPRQPSPVVMPDARRWRLALAVAIGAALPPSAADASSARAQQLAQLTAELRRTLSANREATLSLDCLVAEADLHGSLLRTELEQMAQPLLARVGDAARQARFE